MVRLLKTGEFAQAVGVVPETVRRWIAAGKIKPQWTLGGHARFTEEHVREALGPSDDGSLMTP